MSIICGCEPEERGPSASERLEAAIEPIEVEVQGIGPVEANEVEVKAAEVGPVDVNQAEPEPVEEEEIKAADANLLEVEPGAIEPARIETADVNCSDVEPVAVEASDVNLPEVRLAEIAPPDVNQFFVNPLYERWAQVLSTYVDSNGLVDYKVLRRKRVELIAAVRELGSVRVSEYYIWDDEERMAFWINVYNACTLKVVIDNYPIKPSRYKIFFYPRNSIMHIYKPWTKYEFQIMREKYTLREIERGILLRQFDEPRVCLALSYASLSSPMLRTEPYSGRTLDRQLDEQVKAFILSQRGFRIDRNERTVYVSAIFKDSQYGSCFISRYGTDEMFVDKEPAERAVLNFISDYVSRKDRDFLIRKNYTVKYMKYDWRLNEQ